MLTFTIYNEGKVVIKYSPPDVIGTIAVKLTTVVGWKVGTTVDGNPVSVGAHDCTAVVGATD